MSFQARGARTRAVCQRHGVVNQAEFETPRRQASHFLPHQHSAPIAGFATRPSPGARDALRVVAGTAWAADRQSKDTRTGAASPGADGWLDELDEDAVGVDREHESSERTLNGLGADAEETVTRTRRALE